MLDTTGSMGGLITGAKEKIWSIASSMAQTKPAPEIRMGLVAYRDRGDAYVTKRVELSRDLDRLYEALMALNADGGGDGPESVNQALDDAVARMNWSRDRNVYRVIFLVGDFPPHMDYQDDVKYPVTCRRARELGISLNTIQCGTEPSTTAAWKEIARCGSGEYVQVEQSGGAVHASTPYDSKLAALAVQLDATRIYYGSRSQLATADARTAASNAIANGATIEAQARRATFNASAAGAANFVGEHELVADLEAGGIELASIPAEQLPADLRKLDARARAQVVKDKTAERGRLIAAINDLSAQRQRYLETQASKDQTRARKGFEQKVYDAVRKQAARWHIHYERADALH